MRKKASRHPDSRRSEWERRLGIRPSDQNIWLCPTIVFGFLRSCSSWLIFSGKGLGDIQDRAHVVIAQGRKLPHQDPAFFFFEDFSDDGVMPPGGVKKLAARVH